MAKMVGFNKIHSVDVDEGYLDWL